MTKTDERILSYLKPANGVDTYFVNCYYKDKNYVMDSRLQKVKEWTEKNGGRFTKLSKKEIIGERKGYLVQIVFPCYGKRDMKNIMATLFYQ